MPIKTLFHISLIVMVSWFLSGCEEQLHPVSQDIAFFQTEKVPMQLKPTESQSTSLPAETPSQPTQAISVSPAQSLTAPAICNQIPQDMQTEVWNTLLGTHPDVYIRQQADAADFAVLDESKSRLLRVARSRSLGTRTGSILVFTGINFETTPPVITGPFSFESGNPMPGTGTYSSNKKKFLSQFSGSNPLQMDSKIQGITGATMIWKPVAKEIQQMTSSLVKLGNDTNYIPSLITANQAWNRQPQAAPVTPQVVSSISAEQLAPPIQATMAPIETAASVPQERPKEQTDILADHWQIVGFGELSLLASAVIIISVNSLKGRS